MTDFPAFPKIPRLSRDIVVTEKIDGTNASVAIGVDSGGATADIPWLFAVNGLRIAAGSRTRWLTLDADNFGFARWVCDNALELQGLGHGHHFGEWWGSGIQRGYGLTKGEKKFSLFNTAKWGNAEMRPACCGVVPTLYAGPFETPAVDGALALLEQNGSMAAPGFFNPEGVVIFHTAGNLMFKKTIRKDEEPKGAVR